MLVGSSNHKQYTKLRENYVSMYNCNQVPAQTSPYHTASENTVATINGLFQLTFWSQLPAGYQHKTFYTWNTSLYYITLHYILLQDFLTDYTCDQKEKQNTPVNLTKRSTQLASGNNLNQMQRSISTFLAGCVKPKYVQSLQLIHSLICHDSSGVC